MSDLDQRIAVIGLAGRFPGAPGIESFWRRLRDGVESVRELSSEELRAAGVDESLLAHPRYVRSAVLLEDVELFDAEFFDYGAREAEIMDPQHRVFLECAWEGFEDAGYDVRRVEDPVGIFASVMGSTYLLNNLSGNRRLLDAVGPLAVRIHNDKDFFATRVSYKLNLRGPGVAVQTACSSSLVACHLACQSLLSHECDMALVGGASVAVPQTSGYLHVEGGIYAPDGHCRAFDADARGTVSGNGVGVVVLKRLEDALEDGDRVRAVILGSAVNNDGSLKVGFTAPSVEGQAEVVAAAQEVAGVRADTIDYVEAHGTGTTHGDPIEVAALTQVFREQTSRRGFCAIGSVKTNIGHLDSAAGVASLIKTVLALEHGEIPPSLNCREPNPAIDFPSTPFYVARELTPWPDTGHPRRAAVTSLGVGGTNAHVVLEQAPRREPGERPARLWQLLVVSARTAPAVDQAAERLARHLEATPDVDLGDAAYTLATGRAAFARRRVAVARTPAEAARALAAPGGGSTAAAPSEGREPVFLFPGQGSQYAGMGRELYRHEPVYRASVDRASEILRHHLGTDLRDLLHAEGDEREPAERKLRQTRFAQPALFVTSLALARLWRSWGVAPRALLGHSVGELAAACVAGVLPEEEALELVAFRARLMQSMPRGAMLGVSLAEDRLTSRLGRGVELAAVNAPGHCSVSGPTAAIEAFARKLEDDGVAFRPLRTSHAFHSAMMEPLLDAWTERLQAVPLQTPEIPFLSNVTGTWITAGQAVDPGYWAEQLRRPVRFSDAVETLLEDGGRAFVEVGPGRVLTALVRRHRRGAERPAAVASLTAPRGEGSELAGLLHALGSLWRAGVGVDWEAFFAEQDRRRVPLPTYPFQRRRHWVEPDRSPAALRSAPFPPGAVTLLLVDAPGAAAPLREALQAAGVPTMTVEPGEDAGHRLDLLAERGETVVTVVQPAPADPDSEPPSARLAAELAAALERRGGSEQVAWIGVPRGALEATGEAAGRRLLERAVALVAAAAAGGASMAPPPAPEPPAEGAAAGRGAFTAGEAGEEGLERQIAALWEEQLGVSDLGPHVDFFDAGGDSLLATQILSRLRDRLGVTVGLEEFFDASTIAGLARRIDGRSGPGAEEDDEPPLERVDRSSPLPLSPAQERLWVLDQMNPGSAAYNMPAALDLRGPLDTAALAAAVRGILHRHEALRTAFVTVRGEPVQEIAERVPTPLSVIDLGGLAPPAAERAARRWTSRELSRPFALDRPPLLRLRLLRFGRRRWRLLLVVHHIVSDGWSMNLLLREVMVLYDATVEGKPSPLADLPLQTVDHAVWQRRRWTGESRARRLRACRDRLEGAPERLILPTDRPYPPEQTPRGAHRPLDLPPGLVEGIRTLGRRHDCTPFMVYLAAFTGVMHALSGQEDLVIGTGIAGRQRRELEGLIGCFVNSLPLRVRCGGDPAFAELLRRAREAVLAAFAHPEVPIEALVSELGLERNPAYDPLVQVVLTYIRHPTPPERAGGVEVRAHPFDIEVAKFDLELALVERGGQVQGVLVYRTDLFNARTVDAMIAGFRAILETVTTSDDARLSDLAATARQHHAQRRQALRQETRSRRQKTLERARRTPAPSPGH